MRAKKLPKAYKEIQTVFLCCKKSIAFIFLFAFVTTAVFAQSNKKVTLHLKNVSLEQVLSTIKEQTGMKFIFSDDDLSSVGKVTINISNVTALEAVNKCLESTPLTASERDNTIVISTQGGGIVKGFIRDEKDDSPLIGVNIAIIKGNKIISGTTSDLDGQFTLNVPRGTQLKMTYVGYTDVIMNPSMGKPMNIMMSQTSNALGEVVVNGYFSRKTEGFAGAVTTIKKDDIRKLATGNIFTTISALDAGFKINENNTQGSSPNALPDFTIRGKGSFQKGSTTPLFIMDGFEVSIEKIYDMDINRIESITILKDASATILYGSKAANGVVVIETIAPKPGMLQVSYDFKPTIAFVDLSDYDLMNAKEKLEYESAAGLYDLKGDISDDYKVMEQYYTRYKNVNEGVDTYWLKQPVRDAISQAHSLYVNGGDGPMRYGVDAQFNKTNGVMKESGRDRYGLGFRLIYRIKDKITIQNYISYSYTKAYNSPYGNFSTYGLLNPYERVRDDKGELLPTLLNNEPNPLYDALLPNRSGSDMQSLEERISIDWRITEAWRLRAQFGFEKGTTEDESYTSPFSSKYIYTTKTTINNRGELNLTNGKSMDISGNFTINYNKMLAKKHLLYFSAGGEMQQQQSKFHGFTATGFADDRYSDPAFAMQFKENSKPSSSESTTRSIGLFANINYIFDNRFFADFSGRYDGSSQFGADKRWAPFGSVGAGWNIHNEHFFHKGSILNLLKIRGSYGITGNQEFKAYQAKTMYVYNTDRLYNTLISATLMGYGNSDLKWQNQYQTNIGLDLAMWKNRLNITFNYYNKLTDGMLTQITVAPSLGIPGNSFTSNLGEIQNRGYELSINGAILQDNKRDLEWRVWMQGSSNKNTLKKISNQMKNINAANNIQKKIPGAVYEEGESMNAIKAVHSLGIDPVTGKEIFLKKDGTTITYDWDAEDKILCGDSEPKVYGNIGSNLYWKRWNVNMIFMYSLGADYYNQTLATRVEGANPKNNADRRVLNDRWTTPGQHALYKNIKDYETSYISDRFIQKQNYIRMTSLSLSYDFKTKWMRQARISNLRLSLYANDLFELSTVKAERGLAYPFQRSYTLGLNISL